MIAIHQFELTWVFPALIDHIRIKKSTFPMVHRKSLNLEQIFLIVFVESIPDEYRLKYEVDYADDETGITVSPVFAAIGE